MPATILRHLCRKYPAIRYAYFYAKDEGQCWPETSFVIRGIAMVTSIWVLDHLSKVSLRKVLNLAKPLSGEEARVLECYRTLSEADQMAVRMLLITFNQIKTY